MKKVLKLLALYFVVLLAGQTSLYAAERRPNIIFILADDLGWSDTTLYGHTDLYETPNIERLAARGMTFTRAYSASPLCSPTRAAIMTGLSPARTGITVPGCHLPQVILEATVGDKAATHLKAVMPNSVTRLKTDYETLPHVLKECGYRTAHFGKWHLGREPYSPLEHGFDQDLPHHPGPGPAGSYVAPWKFENFDHDPAVPDQHIEDRMAEEAVRWLEQNHEHPFFLNYWMFSVHAPFDAKRDLIEKYEAIIDPQDRQNCAVYAAMIQSMDDAVGTLLDTLDRLNVADDTIIVFTSDNGGNMYSQVNGTIPTSNWPLRGGKASMFEGGTRVPCVVVWPGVVRPASVSDSLIQSEDFFPTLLAALGVDKGENQRFDGRSFVAVLRGEESDRRSLFQYFPHSPPVPDWLPPSVSVHRDDWKLIRIFHGGDAGSHRYLLFNLANDLSERINLASKHPDLVKKLDDEIEQFLEHSGAVVPVPNPAFDPKKYRPELEGKAKRQRRGRSQDAHSDSSQSMAGFSEWKLRMCAGKIKDGLLYLNFTGKEPFLGIAPGQLKKGAKLRFRIRCNGGQGYVAWLPRETQPTGKSLRKTPFAVKAGGWVSVGVSVPGETGQAGILRLYLPGEHGPVELDWVELEGTRLEKRWNF